MSITCNGRAEKPEAGPFRTVFPQIVASTFKNILILDLGLSLAFPTIVIPALTGIDKIHNPNEYLMLTPSQASWLGSMAYMVEPIGSCLSGWIGEVLGRKKAMILVNIPHIIAWLMMYYASSIEMVFIATGLFGFGTGLTEAPLITYIGEICQPSIRGVLVACAGISGLGGFFMVYVLGSLMEWRNVALICLFIPIITMIAICFIPETPLWLLSKNRTEDARKSLQWLRGWVSPRAVQDEFSALQRYNEQANACEDCIKANMKCPHPPPTTCERIKEILKRPTMKAFLLVIGLFVIAEFCATTAMRPFTVQILMAYGVPIDANWATVLMGFVGLLSNVVLVCVIRFTGKRLITLISTMSTAICCVALAIFGHLHLPDGINSFELASNTTTHVTGNYFPLYAFIALNFCSSLGLLVVPTMIMSEIFPFKSRSYASGIAAAIAYVFWFLSTKTYYNLEMWLSLTGVAWFYGGFSFIGFICIYFLLPETECRTLEEIENHFADDSKSIFDLKIPKGAYKAGQTVEDPVHASAKANGWDNPAYVNDKRA